jgi:hypothetical protein
MMRLITCLLLLTGVTAFTSQPWGSPRTSSKASPSRQFMFSADDKPVQSLKTVDEPEDITAMNSEEESEGMMVKNMNTGEMQRVKWVDPAMGANTDGTLMSWWGYLFAIPFMLIANDVFHFLPADTPFKFLIKY